MCKFKQKITAQTGACGIKDVETMESLKYLSNFWRTLEMPLINCEINLILTWSVNFFPSETVNQAEAFTITDTLIRLMSQL